MIYRRIIKTCTWQLLGVAWFMSYAVVTGGDLMYTLGLSLASIPAGSSLELISVSKVIMEANDILRVRAGTASALDVTVSYLEQT